MVGVALKRYSALAYVSTIKSVLVNIFFSRKCPINLYFEHLRHCFAFLYADIQVGGITLTGHQVIYFQRIYYYIEISTREFQGICECPLASYTRNVLVPNITDYWDLWSLNMFMDCNIHLASRNSM